MTREEIRQQLQSEAFQTLLVGRRLICDWGTGVGKSRVAVNFIDYLYTVEDRCNVLLLVGEDAHKENWRKEFAEAVGQEHADELLKGVTMECYASLSKYRASQWDLIVADEGHHLRSDARIDVLKTLSADRVLVLSATLSDRGDGELLIEALQDRFGDFATLSCGLGDAISAGLLPRPEVNVVPVKLYGGQNDRYDHLTDYLEKKKKEYREAARDNAWMSRTDEELDAMEAKYLHAGSMRKRFLGGMKTGVARRIISDFAAQGKRFICFCATVSQVEALGGENFISSKKSRKQNAEVIRRFNDKEIDSIYAVGMLREGQNLRDIDAGLIVQLDSKARSFVQMFGRVMRSKGTPVLDILYVPETRDEDYLYNCLAELDEEFINGWSRRAYEDRYGIFSLENISRETLCGRPAHYRGVARDYAIVPLTIDHGQFLASYSGDSRIPFSQSVGGAFGDVMTDSEGTVYLNLYDPASRTAYVLMTPWKRSLGLLMPLVTAPQVYHRNIRLDVRPDGGFSQVTLTLDGQELAWSKMTVPPADNGDGDRLNFINNLIRRVNANYRAGQTATGLCS